MKTALAIGLGSFIGGIGRYLLSKLIQSYLIVLFPFGTLTINVIGCFFIGVVFGWNAKGSLDPTWLLFLTTGILGGFTTFSAFSMETVNMMREGQAGMALGYVTLSIVLGMLATYAGLSLLKIF